MSDRSFADVVAKLAATPNHYFVAKLLSGETIVLYPPLESGKDVIVGSAGSVGGPKWALRLDAIAYAYTEVTGSARTPR